LLEVCRRFEASGIKPLMADWWNPASIREIYKRGRLAGFVVHLDEIVGTGNFPAILDEETWREVKQALAGRARGKSQAPRAHVLSGLVKCGNCGARMRARRAYKGTGGRDKDYWRCSRVGGGCGQVSRSYVAVQALANAYVEEMLSRVPNLDPLEAQRSDIELRIASGLNRSCTAGLRA
jgi:site-specific DNA recombinase